MDEEKLQDIRKRAELVRAATEPGENTAERVGGVLVDTVDAVGILEDETRSALDGKASTEELHTLSTKVGGLPTKTDVDAALAAKADLEDGNVPTSQLGNVAAIADERIKTKEEESWFSVRFVGFPAEDDAGNITMQGGTVTIDGQTYNVEPRQMATFRGVPSSLEITGIAAWLDVSKLDVSKLTKARLLSVDNQYRISEYDVSRWNTSRITDMSNAFYGICNVDTLGVGGWDTSGVTNMSGMFNGCAHLRYVHTEAWDISNVTDMHSMFMGCKSLEEAHFLSLNSLSVTDMNNMFNGCESLESVEFLFLSPPRLTRMSGMFIDCKSLVFASDVSRFDTSKVTDMSSMFSSCTSLTSFDASSWDTSNVTDMSSMFSSCTSLTSFDASSWDTSNVTDMRYMFASCTSLTTLTLGEGFGRTPSVKEIDFSWLGKWTDSSVQTLLTLYDRKANGLTTLTLKLSPATAEALGESGKTTLEGRGYAVEVESHDEGKTYLVC